MDLCLVSHCVDVDPLTGFDHIEIFTRVCLDVLIEVAVNPVLELVVLQLLLGYLCIQIIENLLLFIYG